MKCAIESANRHSRSLIDVVARAINDPIVMMTARGLLRRGMPALVGWSLTISSAASADQAGAEALFRQGRQLLLQGNTHEACEKFAASERMDPASGTLLNLADCHTKEGKTATAWAEFLAAGRMARNQGDSTRSEEATRRAKALEPALSHVVIQVSARVPGLQVECDDTVVEEGALATELPVDPGAHVIRASAPGYEAWSAPIQVGTGTQNVLVPALRPEPHPPSPTPARTATSPSSAAHGTKALGFVVGGVGLVATGVGAIFGANALSTYKDAERDCHGAHVHCPSSSVTESQSANRDANIANVTIAAGIVAIGVGAYLVFSPAHPTSRAASNVIVSPWVGSSAGGGAVTGRF